MRATNSVSTSNSSKKVLASASGYWGHSHAGYKVAQQSVFKADQYAYSDSKNSKSDFSSLWITSLNAAFSELGLTYSKAINLLQKSGFVLNSKVLSELAMHNPNEFKKMVEAGMKAQQSN